MDNNIGPDGCAIFYRKEKFQIVNMACEKIITNNSIDSQVFIILQLKHKSSNKNLTIVCLHLKSNEKNHEKRTNQIKYLLPVLERHVSQSVFDMKKHPVLICGDFNGEPFEDFYRLIVENETIKLSDAYSVISEPKQPTTIKFRETHANMLKRGIDYMFYTTVNLELTETFELPVNDQLVAEQGLPNLRYSSDHFALACSFKFLD
jgi:nocturnin